MNDRRQTSTKLRAVGGGDPPDDELPPIEAYESANDNGSIVTLDANAHTAIRALDEARIDIERGDLHPSMVAGRLKEALAHLEREGIRSITSLLTAIPGEWLAEAPPPRRWLLEQADPETDGQTTRGWLPLGKVGMVASAGGVGKTMAMIQLALSVATGRDWYGLQVADPGRVLLALGEEDAEEVRRRLYAAAWLANLTDWERKLVAERLVILPLAGTPVALLERDPNGNPHETAVLEDLRTMLGEGEDWRLVVLDPLVRWAGLDAETDNAQATRFVEAVETLVRAPGGPTVLLVHHTSKAARREGDKEATAARGASALTDGVRWVATMVPVKAGDVQAIELGVVKSNYSHPGEPIVLVRERDGALRPIGRGEIDAQRVKAESRVVEEVKARILTAIAEGHYTSEEALRSAVQCGKSPLQRALAQLRSANVVAKDGRNEPFRIVS